MFRRIRRSRWLPSPWGGDRTAGATCGGDAFSDIVEEREEAVEEPSRQVLLEESPAECTSRLRPFSRSITCTLPTLTLPTVTLGRLRVTESIEASEPASNDTCIRTQHL